MRIATSLLLLCMAPAIMAQKAPKEKTLVESRDQAQGWYLPVKGMVTENGAKCKGFTITVYQDNKLLGEIKPKGKGEFGLELDLDNFYAVRIEKEGFLPELVYFDTHMPEQQVAYPPYKCNLNLEPLDKFRHSDPFYLDFPSAIVRWNDELKGFYHNEGYLSDIQVKMALLQAQVDP